MNESDNLSLFSGIATLLFIIISFVEFRLNTYLQRHYKDITDDQLKQRWHRVMGIENQWNLFSWVLILALFVLPDNYLLLISCILCLLETLVTQRMDNLKRQMPNNQN